MASDGNARKVDIVSIIHSLNDSILITFRITVITVTHIHNNNGHFTGRSGRSLKKGRSQVTCDVTKL